MTRRAVRLSAVLLALWPFTGLAQSDPKASLDELPTVPLGGIPEYQTEAEAASRCRPDIAVWADQVTGVFYGRTRPQFGHTASGVFTCLKAAMRAQYWDANPLAAEPSRGRTFPIDPALLDSGV